MKQKIIVAILLYLGMMAFVHAQCVLNTEMNANGTISKITEPSVLYANDKATILSQLKFDGIDYFFVMVVKPFKDKSLHSKSLEIVLDNDSSLVLDFYDSYGQAKDTSVNLLYRINAKYVDMVATHNINAINVNTNQGQKNFILKLHNDLIKTQLNCLIKEGKKED
jgi:hypothetical protein